MSFLEIFLIFFSQIYIVSEILSKVSLWILWEISSAISAEISCSSIISSSKIPAEFVQISLQGFCKSFYRNCTKITEGFFKVSLKKLSRNPWRIVSKNPNSQIYLWKLLEEMIDFPFFVNNPWANTPEAVSEVIFKAIPGCMPKIKHKRISEEAS